jgi:hypothetical protein
MPFVTGAVTKSSVFSRAPKRYRRTEITNSQTSSCHILFQSLGKKYQILCLGTASTFCF